MGRMQTSRANSLADEHRWLVSGAACPALQQAAQMLQDGVDLQRLAKRLRRQLGQQRGALVLQQAQLRLRARRKFEHAGQMFFTPLGLQQSTDERLARYKARRFPPNSAPFDLCCGIGGDLISLAGHTQTTGFDCDPLTCLLAQANTRVCGKSAEVRCADITEVGQFPDEFVHLDPDRRRDGRRTVDLNWYSPPLSWLNQCVGQAAATAVKLAPATSVPPEWSDRFELQWLGDRRECKQLVVWTGALASHPGRRVATIVDRRSHVVAEVISQGDPGPAGSVHPEPGQFVFQPHPAVVVARLVDQLAKELDASRLDRTSDLLTAGRDPGHPAAAAFEVLDVLPADRKIVQRWVTARRIGSMALKSRGVEANCRDQLQGLQLDGEHAATLLLTRCQARRVAILARQSTPPLGPN